MRSAYPAFTPQRVLVQIGCLFAFLIFTLAIASTARASHHPAQDQSRATGPAPLQDGFELAVAAEAALGRHWPGLTSEARRAFLVLFITSLTGTSSRKREGRPGIARPAAADLARAQCLRPGPTPHLQPAPRS